MFEPFSFVLGFALGALFLGTLLYAAYHKWWH